MYILADLLVHISTRFDAIVKTIRNDVELRSTGTTQMKRLREGTLSHQRSGHEQQTGDHCGF